MIVTSRNLVSGEISVRASTHTIVVGEAGLKVFNAQGKIVHEWKFPRMAPMVPKSKLTEL